MVKGEHGVTEPLGDRLTQAVQTLEASHWATEPSSRRPSGTSSPYWWATAEHWERCTLIDFFAQIPLASTPLCGTRCGALVSLESVHLQKEKKGRELPLGYTLKKAEPK